MGKRRKAREIALQLLFQLDFQEKDLSEVFQHFWQEHPAADDVVVFAERLVEGVMRNHAEIDEVIRQHSTNWRLERMPSVDRNILRVGAYELLFEREIATSVTLNEAIEIAKRYGSEESGSFVNGVLDPIAQTLEKRS